MGFVRAQLNWRRKQKESVYGHATHFVFKDKRSLEMEEKIWNLLQNILSEFSNSSYD